MIEEKRYQFITIKQMDGDVYNGKPFYRIFNNKSKAQLGILSFYKPWKQYVFSSKEDCVFNNSCLRNVLDFMERVGDEQGKELSKECLEKIRQ